MSQEPLIAVFVDYENLALGVKGKSAGKFRIELVMKRLLERGRTANRTDDTADAIARRLKTYRQQEQPVVDALRARGLVTTIDASQPVEAVFEAACAFYDQVGQRAA